MGGPSSVVIYALSYGSFLLNSYLKLEQAPADAVIIDGPVPADRWTLENSAAWSSRVAQDVMKLCASQSTQCARLLGAQGQIPELTMDSQIDGSLHCLHA